jgi:hypothetical protein
MALHRIVSKPDPGQIADDESAWEEREDRREQSQMPDHGYAGIISGQTLALGKRGAGECRPSGEFREARFLGNRYYGRRSFTTCAVSSLFVRWISVGEGVSLPRPRILVVHGTVPQKCARNTLPARSGILCRPALGELRCRPLPTSSARAPEVTPN